MRIIHNVTKIWCEVTIRRHGWDEKFSYDGKDGIRSTVYIWWQGWYEKYSSGGKDGMRSIHLVSRMGWEVIISDKDESIHLMARIGWEVQYSSGGKDGMRSIHLWQGWGWQVFIWWYGWDEKDSPCNFPSYPGVWGKPPVPQIIPGGDGGNPRHCFQVA